MPSSAMLHRMAHVRADISEELRLLVIANVPNFLILVTVMKEAILSSETSVLTRATRRDIPEDGILLYKCNPSRGAQSRLECLK
jgi:hypothetical protein